MTSQRPRHRNPFFENVNEEPQYEVRKVLDQINWDGSLPIDPVEICEMYGFEFEFAPRPQMKEEATTEFYDQGDFKIIINTHGTNNLNGFSTQEVRRRRQRFSFAHELGHCLYKSHTDTTLQKSLNNPSNPHSRDYKKRRESQANEFAAHLLIPRRAFETNARKIGWDSINELVIRISEIFDVSLQVAILQSARLADFPCIAILFNNDGSVLTTPKYSDDFQETKLFYPKHQDLPKGTQAKLLLKDIQPGKPRKSRYRDASTWFPNEPDWKTDKYEVIETSIRLGKHGIASFLEIIPLEN